MTYEHTQQAHTIILFQAQLARLTAEIGFYLVCDKKSFSVTVMADGAATLQLNCTITGQLNSEISQQIELYKEVGVAIGSSSSGIAFHLKRPTPPPVQD